MDIFGGFLQLGVPLWRPHNKVYNILGSILGSPYFGKLPFLTIWDFLRKGHSKGTCPIDMFLPTFKPERLPGAEFRKSTTGTPNVCKMIAFMAIIMIMGFGLLLYIILGVKVVPPAK